MNLSLYLSKNIQLQSVYHTATVPLYVHLDKMVLFVVFPILANIMRAKAIDQDGYKVLCKLLQQTHPGISQTNELVKPTYKSDIWKFIASYKLYVEAKKLVAQREGATAITE